MTDVICWACGMRMRTASDVDIKYLPVVTTSGMVSDIVVKSLCEVCRGKIGAD